LSESGGKGLPVEWDLGLAVSGAVFYC